ncbi:Cof-type HAD-IIB family hydrolase [Clostridium sp.]|uniref:Cof-type HAD-IIB family hydrolase n=1 Tax=Clostridium sp. TaxID=1506 RepID=UPI0026292DEE|nr:Cof-type HAD-IIB family hydrolase [Clostridium sp.]
MERKAVFFDIDGTLYNNKIGVPESAAQGIKELKDNGHYAFISTGRARAMIPQDLIDLGFDGVLAACGAYVEYKGDVIYNIDLEKEIANSAINALRKHNVLCVLEGQDYLYMDEDDFSQGGLFSVAKFKEKHGDKIKPITGEEYHINKITCRVTKDSNFEEAFKAIENEFDCIYHNTEFIELVPKGFTKVKGIEAIIKHLGVYIDNTYAFGDSLNDIDMLKYVKYGIAMGNSNPEVLKIVQYRTDTIENGGIYKGLKQFKLI